MEHLGDLLAVSFWPETAFFHDCGKPEMLRFAVLRLPEPMAWLRSLRNACHHADHQYKKCSPAAFSTRGKGGLWCGCCGLLWHLLNLLHRCAGKLTHGWAISVHTAQGSAFRRVIIPVVQSKLLDRTMFYTAITRGIETVVLVGDIDHINEVVSSSPSSLERTAGLSFALTGPSVVG